MSAHSRTLPDVPRAPRLTPDERRGALIEATIPLLLQHGASVSTRQIAEAAGVAEGTIFRVFDSKEDLVHAAATQLLASDGLITPLAGSRRTPTCRPRSCTSPAACPSG